MLLIDDNDELPALPSEAEIFLASELGVLGLEKIDKVLVSCSKDNWLKVARVVSSAIELGGFTYTDATINLHSRHIIKLVAMGVLESQGNLNKPRFSEVRISKIQT